MGLDNFDQNIAANWLMDNVNHSYIVTTVYGIYVFVSSNSNDGNFASCGIPFLVLNYFHRSAKSVHLGHVQIGENQSVAYVAACFLLIAFKHLYFL